jgi:hypothetical protein
LKLVPEKELVIGIKSQLLVEGLKRLTLPLPQAPSCHMCWFLASSIKVWTKFMDADKWCNPLGFQSEQEYIMCEIEE